jgi:hypothetical protein
VVVRPRVAEVGVGGDGTLEPRARLLHLISVKNKGIKSE